MRARVFNIMQYCEHPITGEKLIDEEQIVNGLNHKSIKRYGYILHDEDDITDDDFRKNKESYEAQGLNIGYKKPPHYHIVLECPNGVELSAVSNWFGVPEAFIDVPKGRGSFLDCMEYLTHESGKEQAKGKHLYEDDKVVANFDFRLELQGRAELRLRYGGQDLNENERMQYDVLYNGLTLRQARKENEIVYMRNKAKLEKFRLSYLSEEAKMPPVRINYYIDGNGGIGKGVASTYLARTLYPDLDEEDCYFIVGSDGAMFEGYDGQPVLIWEDMRAYDMIERLKGRGNVFEVFEVAPKKKRQNVKYSSVVLTNAINIVNGIEPYIDFLDGLAGQYKTRDGLLHKAEDKNQAYRRFPIIIPVRENDFDVLFSKGYMDGTREYEQYVKLYNVRANMRKLVRAVKGDDERFNAVSEKVIKPMIEAKNKFVDTFSPEVSDDDFNSLLADSGETNLPVLEHEQIEHNKMIDEREREIFETRVYDLLDEFPEILADLQEGKIKITVDKKTGNLRICYCYYFPEDEDRLHTFLKDDLCDEYKNKVVKDNE